MGIPDYNIVFTSSCPFTGEGKAIAAIWKKAALLTDFFNRETYRKPQKKISAKMLFDEENLYCHIKTLSKKAFVYAGDDAPFWRNDHFQLLLSGADGGKLCFWIHEGGKTLFYLNKKETAFPDLRFFMESRKKGESFQWEVNFIIPFKYITKKAVKDISSFSYSFLCVEKGEKQQELYALSGADTVTGEIPLMPAKLSREKTSGNKTLHARKEFLKESWNISFTLFPEKASSSVYKNILGINNSPRMGSFARMKKELELFKSVGFARVRHHDAALTDPGYALFDVSRIFPLFHADENDPANYDFGPTDYSLEQVVNCGMEIEFRFGESIEHSEKRFRVNPPPDPEKWARICVNILRHYNEKWANGKEWNISYVSLWEEPDNPKLFNAPFEEYLKLYKVFSLAMRKAFPKLRIGGGAIITSAQQEALLACCKENALPLDFLGTTAYAREPWAFAGKISFLRELAAKYGYADMEIFMSEWNHGPLDWSDLRPEREIADSMEKASFTLASLISMENVVDMAYFYYWAGGGNWSCLNLNTEPYKLFHALKFYTAFVNKGLKKVPAELSMDFANNYYLSGMDEKGKVYLLLAPFQSPAKSFSFTLPSDYNFCKVKILSNAYPEGEGLKEIRKDENGNFLLTLDEKTFGVYLLEFDR